MVGADSWLEQYMVGAYGWSILMVRADSWLEQFMVGAYSWLEQIYGWSKTSVIGPSHLPDDS